MKKIPTLFLRDWEGDRRFVTREVNEGVVWHHDGDDRMAKIKKRDFRAP